MNRYRVVSVQWIDVTALSIEDAIKNAGDVFYTASESERVAFPSVLHVVDMDVDGGDESWPIIDDVLGVVMDGQTWDPTNGSAVDGDPF